MGLQGVWNVPYPRNAWFTGREDLLSQLETALHAGEPTALSQPQAISGLGGIGKTQVALEYAYRYRSRYHTVLWAQADMHETLTSSYLAIATLLDLPEKETSESTRVIAAVKHWLITHTNWLLILDNADELTLARDFLSPTVGGHVLLTTRAQAMGRLARRVDVEVLPTEVGALFLLRRAGLSDRDAPMARAICQEVGGLPLALDQAGAYIEETGCSLLEYQRLFQHRRADLLAKRGGLVEDHPHPVATTWSLSFERVEQKNPAAADLLRVCAFLAPDAIPAEIITGGAEHLGLLLAPVAEDPVLLDEAIAVLGCYSLIRRDGQENTFSIHRLVQAVLTEAMEEEKQREWRQRVLLAVHAVLPAVEHQQWSRWERLVVHVQACAQFIEQDGNHLPQATALLQQTGWYLMERARYSEAEPLLVQAYTISRTELGEEHEDTATDASTLGLLYKRQGRYEQAEPLLVQALAIRELKLGAEHLDTAGSLNNLAELYCTQGKYVEAEPLLVRALAISEQELGANHPVTATSLNNLAGLYCEQGKYAEAEPLFVRALAISEQEVGPDTANSLNNLAALYYKQGKNVEAESLFVRALAIDEQVYGETHPAVATTLNDLASLYQDQGKDAEAEPLLERALLIREQKLGAEHPNTARSRSNLVALYYKQGKYEQAEPLLVRVLSIRKRQLGASHPDMAQILNNLAALYQVQGKYAEAEPLLVCALAISEQEVGANHPDTARSLSNLAELYYEQGKYEQAEPLMKRVLAIREQKLGATHPDTATSLNNLAELYRIQRKYVEAEPLYVRALSIREQELDPHHPATATSLNNLVLLYLEQGRYVEAEPLLERALSIREQELGLQHPDTIQSLWWLAVLAERQRHYQRAKEHYQRALSISERALGQDHPKTQTIRKNYALFLQRMKQDGP
jgi:tetratricopeptide (TPR) repeat protein